MSDESQLIIPPSFVELYLTSGRIKPNAPREEILVRYEFCEDLATTLTEHTCTKLVERDLSEREALALIYRGLLADESGVTAREAQWVIRRLAELLNWVPPNLDWVPATPS